MTAPVPLPLSEQHRLIVGNQGLVYHIAQQIGGSLPIDERVSYGNWGMVIAARKYDPLRAVQFSTYASHWIRAYIYKGIMREMGVPDTNNGRKLFFGLRKAVRDIEQAGHDATDARVAMRLGMQEDKVSELRARIQQTDSHFDGIGDDGETRDAHDGGFLGLVADDNPEDAAIALNDAAKSVDRVAELLRALTPKEREVIVRRFLNEQCETLKEIGDSWGQSREWVRQIEAIALRKMRMRMEMRR